MGALEWLAWPFVICVVLVGIHGYLGIHVLARKVIFVDLAMAQVAALGATYALALGYDPSRPGDQAAVFGFSTAFALAGAAVFAFTRMRHEKVPQEAFIGIVYASATAIAILVLAKLPHGGEHLRHMLEGNILFVGQGDVIKTAVIYAAVGIFHWVFRRKFFLISFEPERALAEGVRVRLWDFLFYASFGVVITSSVAVAGVLLVFAYLVVPACVAILFVEGARSRLVAAWIVGVAVTVAGMMVSYYGGLPTGPSVVGAFAVVLAIAGIVYGIHVSPAPGRAVLRVGSALGGVALLAWGTTLLARIPEEHGHHDDEFTRLVSDLRGGEEARVIDAIDHLVDSRDAHVGEEFVSLLKSRPSDLVTEHLAHGLAKIGHTPAVPDLVEAAIHADDSLKVEIARSILALKSVAGAQILVEVAGSDAPALAKAEAVKTLATLGAPASDFKGWWESRGRHLKWRETTKRFE